MNLPRSFHFHQSNLQDFIDCRRRFQLKYKYQLQWPAIEIEPAAENLRLRDLGSQFHHMVHQIMIGIESNAIKIPENFPELSIWWNNFLDATTQGGSLHSFLSAAISRYPEISLNNQLTNVRLTAKYDLITVQPNGEVKIFDWKTTNFLPNRAWVAKRVQTIIYPYLIACSGSYLTKTQEIQPEQIEMIYWFASSPNSPIRFKYTREQFNADARFISDLIGTIQNLNDEDFFPTTNDQRCSYCVYRSLCARGSEAGQIIDPDQFIDHEDEIEFNIDTDQIEMIAF